MRVLLTENAGLTSRQVATRLGELGHEVEVLSSRRPGARFMFVPAKGYRPERGELRFGMFEAEFTHEGDLCTFEVLVQRFGLTDPALRAKL